MKFTLTIDCNNSAFEDIEEEIARILEEVSSNVVNGYRDMTVRDTNGNAVGRASLCDVVSTSDDEILINI